MQFLVLTPPSGFSGRKPWSNLILILIAFSFTLFLSLLATAWHTAEFTMNVKFQIPSFSSFRRTSITWKRPPLINPYDQPGQYNHDEFVMENNRWVPIDGEEPPRLIEILRNGPEEAGAGYSWFKNRTVVQISDSIGRNQITHTCLWLGGTWEPINVDSPLYPSHARLLEQKYFPNLDVPNSVLGRPHTCTLENWNTVFVYLWIITPDREAVEVEDGWSTGGFWSGRFPFWTPPSLPQDRVKTVVAPLLNNLEREDVDLVEVSVTAWSLDGYKWSQHDRVRQEGIEQGLPEEQAEELASDSVLTPLDKQIVKNWRDDLHSLLHTIRQTLGPRPPIRYRTFHQTPPNHVYPHKFAAVRTVMLNSAVQSLVSEEKGWEVNDWAEMIRGQEYTVDHIHPGAAANWLWLDAQLFRLWQAVTAAEEGKRYPMVEDLDFE